MEPLVNVKIKKQAPLRQIVYDTLKDAILSGRVGPGTKLYELKLADEFGISRTPVREALHSLEREFLITSIDKVGYVVKDLYIKDLEEISEIRKSIEWLAAKEALSHCSEDWITRLEENLKQSGKLLARGKQDLFLRMDEEFHNLLYSNSKSERLTRLADNLRKEMQRFRAKAGGSDELARTALDHHRTILAAVKAKDHRELKKAIEKHIDDMRKYIAAEFNKRS